MTPPLRNDENESCEIRQLQDNEVDAVSGGIIAILIGMLVPAVRTYGPITND